MDDAQDESEITQYVAGEIRAQLARHRLSGHEAARRLGWHQTQMHRRMTGERPIQAHHVYQIARMLGVPVDTFFPPLSSSGRKGMNALYLGRALAA